MPGRFLIPPAMRVGHKYTHTNPIENTKKIVKGIGTHLKENYNPRDPLFTKDNVEGRNVNNLWTGYKLGGKGKIAVGASVLGGGAIMVADPRGVQSTFGDPGMIEAQSDELDVESLQSTRSDGLGYQAQLSTSALQDLSASGDLVFAMHKTRHSGQF